MTLWEVLVPVRDPECPRDAFSFTPFRLEVGRKASSLHFQFRVLFRERFFRAISAKTWLWGSDDATDESRTMVEGVTMSESSAVVEFATMLDVGRRRIPVLRHAG